MMISIANQSMLQLWGKSKSVIGFPLLQAIPELIGQPFFDILTEVFVTGKTYEAKEDPADLIVDGLLQRFYFTFTYKAIRDDAGDILGIFNTATDVTELVTARKLVDETRQRLSFALSSAKVGTWDLDPINNHVEWDERCKVLFGFMGNSDVVYEQVLSCIHPDDKFRVHEAVTNAIQFQSDGAYDIKYRTVNRNSQRIRWVHCKGKAYANSDHVAYRFAGTALDVTTEVESRKRELQLLSLVEHNMDHMSIADMNGNLIYMNRAARNMLGVAKHTDVTKLSAKDFYTPGELNRVQESIVSRINAKSGWRGIIHLKRIDSNEIIPCHVNYMLIKDPITSEVIGRGATARDMRPEIKAKVELQRLATIVEVSEDFCNYCDINGNTIYINESGRKLIGIDAEAVHSSKLYDYHTNATNELIDNEVLTQLKATGKWSGTLELLHLVTGEIIPIHKQMFMIREDITNEPIAIAGIARDLRPEIAARKIINEKNLELSQLVHELNFLADSVPAVVWSSTPEGMFDYINQRWVEKAGISIEEALGRGWQQTIHPDDSVATVQSWKSSLKSGEPFQEEFRLQDNSGEYRWWYVLALALKDGDGNIIKWYGSNMDITEQKELAKQKDNFLAVASHELKTPVTSIKAYAQVMESLFRRSGDIKNADLMAKMDKQVNRLNTLIEDLLDVTKINSGRMRFNYTSFDFNDLMEEVTESMQLTTLTHHIEREANFNRTVNLDRERIGQVVINLLTNAIKYSPDANRVKIYTEDHGAYFRLCVQDFGIGISSEKQERVFEEFYRVSGSQEHTIPGLGLGLYICAQIVKRMGGKIMLKSSLGEGSTFIVTLPLDAEKVDHTLTMSSDS